MIMCVPRVARTTSPRLVGTRHSKEKKNEGRISGGKAHCIGEKGILVAVRSGWWIKAPSNNGSANWRGGSGLHLSCSGLRIALLESRTLVK
jgi:hypothetical protein